MIIGNFIQYKAKNLRWNSNMICSMGDIRKYIRPYKGIKELSGTMKNSYDQNNMWIMQWG